LKIYAKPYHQGILSRRKLTITANPQHTTVYRPIKIMFWNAHRVLNDQYLLSEFLAQHRIDTAFIKETRLQPIKKWSIPVYTIYRTETKMAEQQTDTTMHTRNPHPKP
jgi:hypothetical protein